MEVRFFFFLPPPGGPRTGGSSWGVGALDAVFGVGSLCEGGAGVAEARETFESGILTAAASDALGGSEKEWVV